MTIVENIDYLEKKYSDDKWMFKVTVPYPTLMWNVILRTTDSPPTVYRSERVTEELLMMKEFENIIEKWKLEPCTRNPYLLPA